MAKKSKTHFFKPIFQETKNKNRLFYFISSKKSNKSFKFLYSFFIFRDLSYELSNKLGGWFKSTSDWTEALRKIILGNEKHYDLFPKPLTINSYLENNAGPLERPKNPVCGKEVKWCTTSELENTKCQWVAKESEALGITPKIVCVKEISTFECLRSINQKRSDLTSIDSNYGYVARK